MIFTFYSYKGGVGRSMALASVAQHLAERGLRVLTVDFDLEAPGLERYFFDGEGSRVRRRYQGLLDLIQSYKRALSSQQEFERGDFKRLMDFTQVVQDPVGRDGGTLSLLSAGQREPEERLRDYAWAVRTFDWQDFFDNWEGGVFFEWLRQQWLHPDTGYDVVLVDSRTGVTEMGGVCAYQLADTAVLLCAPNYQNLDGTRDVARDFRSDAVLAMRKGRPLDILVIPARLEAQHPRREDFLQAFEQALGTDGLPKVLADAGLNYRNLALPYLPDFAVEETLVGETNQSERTLEIRQVFLRLADALTLLAPTGSRMARHRAQALARLSGQAVQTWVPLEADTSRASAGFDVFMDADSVDAPEARVLAQALEGMGLRVFMDSTSLDPGTSWSEAVERALRYSATLMVCFGRATSSALRETVIRQARSQARTRIVPVLLSGASTLQDTTLEGAIRSFGLDSLPRIDLREGLSDASLAALNQALRGRDEHVAMPPPSGSTRPPYPGLMPYTEDDAAFFVGREREVRQLQALLLSNDVIVITGAAQAGKTSLVQAGLIPALRRERTGYASTMAPCLVFEGKTLVAPDQVHESAWLTVVDHLDSLDGLGDGTGNGNGDLELSRRSQCVQQWMRQAGPGHKLILIARNVSSELGSIALSQIGRDKRLHVLDLPPLSGPELRSAIEEPAKRAGHLLEPGLAERLIEAAGSAHNAMAQIQLVLAKLWLERRRGWLTNKSLDALGNLAGVFAAHLQSCQQTLSDHAQAATFALYAALIRLDSSLKHTGAPLPWSLLATIPLVRQVRASSLRDQLASWALIDLWQEPETSIPAMGPGTGTWVSLTSRPAAYLEHGVAMPTSEFFLWRSRFLPLALNGLEPVDDGQSLLSGPMLNEAEGWLKAMAGFLTQVEVDLIEASLAERHAIVDRQKQLEQAQRAQEKQALQWQAQREERDKLEALKRAQSLRRQRLVLSCSTGLAVFTTCVALWFYKSAQHELHKATSLRLVAESIPMLQGNRPGGSERALLQLLAAYRIGDSADVEGSLLDALQIQQDLIKVWTTGDRLLAMAVSADRRVIASVQADQGLQRWDALTGLPMGAALKLGPRSGVRALALSPDGRRAATASEDLMVRLWDLESGRLLRQIVTQHTDGINALVFGPDGTRLASGSDDRTVRLWDALTGQALAPPMGGHRKGVKALAFSPDGQQLLSASSDASLVLREAATGRTLHTFDGGHEQTVWAVTFSPDGQRIASGGEDNQLVMWDARSGELLGQHKGHSNAILAVAFSADGRLVSTGGADKSVIVWDAASGQRLGPAMRGHGDRVMGVAFRPEGHALVSGSADGTLQIHGVPPAGLALSKVLGIQPASAAANSVAVSADGQRLLAGGDDHQLRLWDLARSKLVTRPKADSVARHTQAITSVAFSEDGRLMASGSDDHSVRLWDATTGQAVGLPLIAQASIEALSFSSDNRHLAAADHDGAILLWDLKKPDQPPLTWRTHPGNTAWSVAFSPDGKQLVSGHEDRLLRLWDTSSGQLVGSPWAGHSEAVYTVSFSPDGQRVLSGSRDRSLRTWLMPKGTPSGLSLMGHSGWVLTAAFSHDGKRIVSGSKDNTLRFWDAQTGQPIGSQLLGHTAQVNSVVFGKDDRAVFSASSDGTVRQWSAPDAWPDDLCAKLTRNPTPTEWSRWIASADIGLTAVCDKLPTTR